MKREPTVSFLEEAVVLLVQHFGIARVQAALSKVSNCAVETSEGRNHRSLSNASHQASPSITSILKQLRQKDEEKYLRLTNFYTDLKDKKVLLDSQDIRFFAHIIGLKEISGKSRKDMIPKIMRFLFAQSTEQIKDYVERAATVSEQQRQQGFSVLTDKLLGD